MASSTSSIYVGVIEDVIGKVRDEFVSNGGPGEDVLKELQGLWEAKMMQAGVVNERAKVHDLNVPYEDYETPTADMLFPPTPLQTPLPPDPTPSPSPSPSPYMQPPSPWMTTPRAPLDVNVAYIEGRDDPASQPAPAPAPAPAPTPTPTPTPTQDFFTASGKRKRDELPPPYQPGGFVPQQDGPADSVFQVIGGSSSTGSLRNREVSPKIPQLDGPIPEPYDDVLSTPSIYNYQGVYNEDYNIANTPAPNELPVSTPALPAPNDVGEDDDDDEPPLNENDDDDELDDVDEGEEINTQHLVLAQFDKVTRTKSRWKCTLKDGIMHINNKDILFNKATGEFDF